MLKINLDEAKGIAFLEPLGELSKNDFISASKIIDPYIKKAGKLNGLIIHVKSFPGWDSFGALIEHLKFIKEHHKKISRIAFATDSAVGGFVKHIGSHFISAELRTFSFVALILKVSILFYF